MHILHATFATMVIVAVGASSAFADETSASATATTPAAAPAAQTTAVPALPAQNVSMKDPNAIVCKRLEAETGTRIGSRTQCMTNAQWDDAERQSQQMMRNVTKASSTFADKPG